MRLKSAASRRGHVCVCGWRHACGNDVSTCEDYRTGPVRTHLDERVQSGQTTGELDEGATLWTSCTRLFLINITHISDIYKLILQTNFRNILTNYYVSWNGTYFWSSRCISYGSLFPSIKQGHFCLTILTFLFCLHINSVFSATKEKNYCNFLHFY